jgi:flavin-dependent dehydrogenase
VQSESNGSKEISQRSCDILVVGGGPAGSTVAALLAERGHDVVVLEKDHHPRFHIGESLLPMNIPLFEKLGVQDQVAAMGMRKYAAEFVSPQHEKTVTFEFGNALDKSFPYAYQVRRSEFDDLLLRNAQKKGATVIEGCRVNEVEFLKNEGALVNAAEESGERVQWRTRFFVDASGRDTFMANKLAMKDRIARHNSAAIYGHFTGATRNEGRAEGNITIYWFDHGWFWFIPLHDGATSVGAVCWPYYMKSRKTEPTQFFLDTIALAPALAERLKDAKLTGPATATGNYSYKSKRMGGDRYLMLGDAFAFIDPIFSSGVYLAMNSAFLGADVIETCLREPARADAALKGFDRTIRHGLHTFSWFIFRATSPSFRDLIMDPKNVLGVEEAVLSLLAGDIFRDTPIFWRLKVFKGLYYSFNFFNPKRTWEAWKRRRFIIRDPQPEALAR